MSNKKLKEKKIRNYFKRPKKSMLSMKMDAKMLKLRRWMCSSAKLFSYYNLWSYLLKRYEDIDIAACMFFIPKFLHVNEIHQSVWVSYKNKALTNRLHIDFHHYNSYIGHGGEVIWCLVVDIDYHYGWFTSQYHFDFRLSFRRNS